ncbi:MAG TPA: S41 family peptidase [Streptosporangiaceae bacterium]|jgi:hypothetical protein
MQRSDLSRVESQIDREVKARFPDGAVRKVRLLPAGENPAIEPDGMLVRVYVNAPPGGSTDAEQAFTAWQAAHRGRMRQMRRELSLRMPENTVLQFTAADDEVADAPVITMRHDEELVAEPVSPREIVQTAMGILRARYVFPERAEAAAAAISTRLNAGEYDGLSESELAARLTAQLFEVCADKHLRVRYDEEGERRRRGPAEPKPPAEPRSPEEEPERPAWRKPGSLGNYGIYKVERLEGNVGYIELRGVPAPAHAGEAIVAAMQLVSGTDALILDLRENRGGSPDGVVFWCSYLLENRTHLNDIFVRETGDTNQFWSLAYVPGERYLDRPVYVLTSSATFSGGEDLCYTLQALDRAKIIGEATGGGAHPTEGIPLSSTMMIGVPFARSVNPITGTNWEGTGVIPDLAVPADQAFNVGYAAALRHVLASPVSPPPLREEASDALATLPADLPVLGD